MPCPRTSAVSLRLAEFRLPTIDLQRTFFSTSKIVWLAKLLLVLFGISGIAVNISNEKFPVFWLAYLTHFDEELIGTYYLIMSFVVSLGRFPVLSGEDEKGASTGTALTKIVWGVFPTIMTLQTIIILVYFMIWFTVYEGAGTKVYDQIFGHGLLYLAIEFDGHVLNRTPIRMKQIIFI